ncbi:MAG: beta-ketoacyl-[acyl-carrier-protein] synthase II [Gammaproteobacteria bacterium]|nr:MAG: beta-ketoacyl-[acyl-carrier-protein] synthase II [Gammaproteobacteria bacterium]
MSGRRVVVTGMGMLTPVGLDVPESWSAILAGKSGAATIDKFDVSDFSVRFSASVKDFDVTRYMDAKEARRVDVFVQYGMAASIQAIEDAGLEVDPERADRYGVSIGSGIGGIVTIESTRDTLTKSGPRRVSPFFVPGSVINMISGIISIRYGMKGPNLAVVTACTTGTHNIGLAGRLIRDGDVDVMVAGGAEMATSPVPLAAFSSMKALSQRNDDPEAASRPWDRGRDGFVLGDGAGILVLEEYEHARKRGAKIYAELAGFGMSGDAYHITSPPEDGAGAVASMRNALRNAGMDASEIDYINAHGTSTSSGDVAEARAIKTVFGGDTKIAVSSTKSMIGHLLGAAGSVEAIFSVLAIREGVAPPTINLDDPDDGCDLDFVPHQAKEMKINGALSNSFGFGGTNGTLIFRRVD